MRIKSSSFSIYGNELWCVCELSQTLIKIDFLTNTIEETSNLPFEINKEMEDGVLIYAFNYGVMLVPNIQSTIFVYMKNEHEWRQIDFFNNNKGGYLFACLIEFGNSIYMFPGTSDDIIVYNILNGKVEHKRKLLSYISSKLSTKVRIINPVCKMGNHRVVGTTSVNNSVFIYDVLNDDIDIFKVGDDASVYSSCAFAKEKIILYDKTTCTLRMIDEKHNVINEVKVPFGTYRLLKYSEEIMLLDSFNSNDIYIIDNTLKNCLVYSKCDKSEIRKENGLGKVICGDGMTYYYNVLTNSICSIDLNGFVKCQEMPNYNDKLKRCIIENTNNRVIKEDNEVSLSYYLSVLS